MVNTETGKVEMVSGASGGTKITSQTALVRNCYFVNKIVLIYCEKKCFSHQERRLKFETEGREFAKFMRSMEQFIQTVNGQNNFC